MRSVFSILSCVQGIRKKYVFLHLFTHYFLHIIIVFSILSCVLCIRKNMWFFFHIFIHIMKNAFFLIDIKTNRMILIIVIIIRQRNRLMYVMAVYPIIYSLKMSKHNGSKREMLASLLPLKEEKHKTFKTCLSKLQFMFVVLINYLK